MKHVALRLRLYLIPDAENYTYAYFSAHLFCTSETRFSSKFLKENLEKNLRRFNEKIR